MEEEKPEKVSDEDLLEEVIDRFKLAEEADREEREKALDDIRFINDEDGQWDQDAVDKRKGKPCMTFDQLGGHVDQIMGDFLQNRPGIKVRGVDDTSDQEMAEKMTGLIRHIENLQSGKTAYKNGFKYAITGGYGAWRVMHDYPDSRSMHQDLFLQKIDNPFRCLPDPDSEENTKCDGMFWFITEDVPEKEFKRRYPKAEPDGLDVTPEGTDYSLWYHSNCIRVAEYYRKVPRTINIYQLEDGKVIDDDELAEKPELEAMIVDQREAESHCVEWYKVTGTQVLERRKLKGRYIPVIACYGKTINIDGKKQYRGVVRKGKDPQRSYNYHRSEGINIVALQPIAPLMYTPAMIEGFEGTYRTLNTNNHAGLPYNPDPLVPGGRPMREPPPTYPSALMNEAIAARDDIKAATGIYDASLGKQGNETSGKAILARQREGDIANFEFIDNFSEAIELTGRIILDLIPYVYDTNRIVRILDEAGEEEPFEVNRQELNPETNELQMVNDLTVGKYDLVVTTGSSYASRRVETAEQLTQVMQSNPEIGAIITDLWIDSLDLVNGQEAKDRVRKYLVQQGIVEPNEEEQQLMQPSPEEQQAQQQAQQVDQMVQQLQIEDAQAETMSKKAKAAKDFADAKAQELETDMVESGVMELING